MLKNVTFSHIFFNSCNIYCLLSDRTIVDNYILNKKKTNPMSPSQKLREEIAFEFLISKCSDGRLSKQDL